MDEFTTPAFMRSGRSNPPGKLTYPVPAFKVCVETEEGLRQLAADVGMSAREFVRRLIKILVHGEEFIASIERERLAVGAGKSSW